MINYGLMIMLNKGFKLTNTNTLKVTFLICIRKKIMFINLVKKKYKKAGINGIQKKKAEKK